MVEGENRDEELISIGRSIVDRIRRETNDEYAYFSPGESDVFRTLYLTESDRCLPDHFIGDDLLRDIRAIYAQVFDGLREELRDRLGLRGLWLAIDPSYEDLTFTVLCTHEQVLMLHWSKAWNFFWPDEEAMAADLGRILCRGFGGAGRAGGKAA